MRDTGRLKAMRRGLIEGGYESTAVKSGAINQLEGLLSRLLFVLQTRGLGYRCILSRQSSKLPLIAHGHISHSLGILSAAASGQSLNTSDPACHVPVGSFHSCSCIWPCQAALHISWISSSALPLRSSNATTASLCIISAHQCHDCCLCMSIMTAVCACTSCGQGEAWGSAAIC